VTSSEQPYGELVDTTLRVMTWNVWGRFGPWRDREPALVSVIAEADPDIVLLQEAWCDDRGADQAAVLGGRLGLHHCFAGGELLFGDWGLGNAVLSRWPIHDPRLHVLPALEPGGWGGVALRAVLEGPRGRVLAYDVALDWPPQASAARRHALAHLAGIIEDDLRLIRAPLIVGGDFNAGPDSDEIRMLTGRRETARPGFVLFDTWGHAGPPPGPGHTWSSSNPWVAPSLLRDQRIDHLFTGWPRRGGVGSPLAATLAGVDPVDGVVASDHYAVVADLRY
jgi:endonuclease/exonuclease/phosphatase family metal-dependent hydrolase